MTPARLPLDGQDARLRARQRAEWELRGQPARLEAARSVAHRAELLCDELGLAKERVDVVVTAAWLHEAGAADTPERRAGRPSTFAPQCITRCDHAAVLAEDDERFGWDVVSLLAHCCFAFERFAMSNAEYILYPYPQPVMIEQSILITSVLRTGERGETVSEPLGYARLLSSIPLGHLHYRVLAEVRDRAIQSCRELDLRVIKARRAREQSSSS